MRPGKDRQAQVDSGRIDGINHLVEIESVGIPGIQPSRSSILTGLYLYKLSGGVI